MRFKDYKSMRWNHLPPRLRIIGLTLCLFLMTGAPAWSQNPSFTTLPAGTEIEVELLEHLHSRYSRARNPVFLRVVDDLVLNGHVLVAKDTPVSGVLRKARGALPYGQGAFLSLEAQGVLGVDGSTISLESMVAQSGAGRSPQWLRGTQSSDSFRLFAGLFVAGESAHLEKGLRFIVSTERTHLVELQEAPHSLNRTGEPPPLRAKVFFRPDGATLIPKKGGPPLAQTIYLEPPEGYLLSEIDLPSLRMSAVNGYEMPSAVRSENLEYRTGDADRNGVPDRGVKFEGWSVLRYCSEGKSEVTFRWKMVDGSPVEAMAPLYLSIREL